MLHHQLFKVVAKAVFDLINANPAQPEKGLEVQLYGMGYTEGDRRALGWVTPPVRRAIAPQIANMSERS
jgi:hypothetical protein